ncbi:hypothetical protein H6F95_26835 [Cyanobacteria bacterium FACHB-471]|nr:hypothetical protein [Cyanobacteria bacterium FACHB-471]
MPKLTKTRLAQVSDILDESFFTSAGFTVETSEDQNRIVLVQFCDNDKYFIELRYATKRPSSLLALTAITGMQEVRILKVEQASGDFVEVESHEVESFAKFLDALRLWTERIKNEYLLVNLFQQRLEHFQDELNKRLDEHIDDENAHFSEEERADLYEKLNQF